MFTLIYGTIYLVFDISYVYSVHSSIWASIHEHVSVRVPHTHTLQTHLEQSVIYGFYLVQLYSSKYEMRIESGGQFN